VGDAFTDPYVVVWGSRGEDSELVRLSLKTASALAGQGPCFADVNMPEELLKTHNLVVVGSAESNLFLQQVAESLPVTVHEASIIADGDSYGLHETGYIVIYPNPMNPARYVLVFSAASCEVMDKMYEAYLQMESMEAADVGVFGIGADGSIKWHTIEKFDTTWCWHARRHQVLCRVTRRHAKWRWAQWAGRAVRKELGADVMILEMPFRFSDLPPVGAITQRALFHIFRNDWVVKVALDGRSLRGVVTRLITGAQNKRGSGRVLDGLRFAADNSTGDEDFLQLSKIDDEAEYTMCFPEQMATELTEGTDYEIRGEGYMVGLLESHLCRNKEADIDAQLDAFKPNVF